MSAMLVNSAFILMVGLYRSLSSHLNSSSAIGVASIQEVGSCRCFASSRWLLSLL
jgi:hypothetical protein